MIKIKEAPFILNQILMLVGMVAITMPWKTVYLKRGYVAPDWLIRHETVHVQQIEQLGALKFTFLYLWYSLKYGYENNPFEVEARKAE